MLLVISGRPCPNGVFAGRCLRILRNSKVFRAPSPPFGNHLGLRAQMGFILPPDPPKRAPEQMFIDSY